MLVLLMGAFRHQYPDPTLIKIQPALIYGASEVARGFMLELSSSFPATGYQKLIEVGDARKLRTFMRRGWPRQLLVMLWVRNGRVTWCESWWRWHNVSL